MAALRIKAAGTGGSEGSDHEQRVAGFEGSSARPAKAAFEPRAVILFPIIGGISRDLYF
jgi:hypothetical protein